MGLKEPSKLGKIWLIFIVLYFLLMSAPDVYAGSSTACFTQSPSGSSFTTGTTAEFDGGCSTFSNAGTGEHADMMWEVEKDGSVVYSTDWKNPNGYPSIKTLSYTFEEEGSYTVTLYTRFDGWWWTSGEDEESVTLTITNCGNGQIDSGEQCDGSNLGGETCESLGYGGGGTLRCNSDCSYDTSRCVSNRPPSARFSFTPSEPFEEEAIKFDASGSSDPDGDPLTYYWDFQDDGNIDATQSSPEVQFSYSSVGVYTVRLTVEDDSGAADSTTKSVRVKGGNQVPSARFTFNPTDPETGKIVAFNASGSEDPDGSIEGYNWDFGDGSTDSGQIVRHAFQNPGSYTVELVVTDDGGGTGRVSHTVTVRGANKPPSPKFSFYPQNPLVGQGVTFDASGSSDPDGNIASYAWKFGDGNTGTGNKVTHSYGAAGNYSVELEVTDNNGASAKLVKEVSVQTTTQPPIASFFFSPDQPSVEQEVNFDASSSEDPDGNIASYAWKFGDGNTGAGVSPRHSYTSPGDYRVSLKVTDNEGAESQLEKTVKVRPKIRLKVKKMQLVPDKPSQIQVDFLAVVSPLGSLNPLRTAFSFGDGSRGVTYTGLRRETYHKYEEKGTFTARVKVVFSDGTEIEDSIQIENPGDGNLPPVPEFSYSPLRPTVNETVFFDASNSHDLNGSIDKYEWYFDPENGEQPDAVGKVAVYSFNASGNHIVKLVVTDNEGKSRSLEKTVSISDIRATLKVTYTDDPLKANFHLELSPSGHRNVDSTTVDYGDGNISVYTGLKTSFTHRYSSPGVYQTEATVKFSSGDTVSDRETVYIQSPSGLKGRVSIHLEDEKERYSANKSLTGTVKVFYNRLIPQNSTLKVFINGEEVANRSMGYYLYDSDYYSFTEHVLFYNVTGEGKNVWETYPDQEFNYTIQASGTKGSNSTPWGPINSSSTGSVNYTEGLKFIVNGKSTIGVPSNNNDDTVWEEVGNSNSKVETTMRRACGGEIYKSFRADKNGWINISLDGMLAVEPGTNNAVTSIPGGFDGKSLREPERRKFGGMGGIYKNGKYQEREDDVFWDEEQDFLRIYGYDSTANYRMVYMAPSGSHLCAYTEYKNTSSSEWEKSTEFRIKVRYDKPYRVNYTKDELKTMLPPQPCDQPNCHHEFTDYKVNEVYDASNSITLESSFQSDVLRLKASTQSKKLRDDYLAEIDMENLDSVVAPDKPGSHNLTIRLVEGGEVIAENSTTLLVCQDPDGDGYCPPEDCNDNKGSVYPGAPETCNGEDDDCDGKIDEDFSSPGKVLGTPCNNWEGSVCAGVWACNQNGTGVMCKGNYSVGELNEICKNGKDDDCDGRIDETNETVNGKLVPGCFFEEGTERICGSNIGYCRFGKQIFTNGQWSDCIGNRKPKEETCNQIDDDCDSIVDDVGGGSSVRAARCQCYGGGEPQSETCNQIDDDCDGQTDEGIRCCSPGETKSCGESTGVCEEGTQTCGNNGEWSECKGGKGPGEELCGNHLDDDCDGETDEYCEPEVSCNNGIRDTNEDGIDCGGPCPQECEGKRSSSWILLSFVGIVMIVVAGTLAFMGKI